MEKFCRVRKEDAKEEKLKLGQYGEWLKASVFRTSPNRRGDQTGVSDDDIQIGGEKVGARKDASIVREGEVVSRGFYGDKGESSQKEKGEGVIQVYPKSMERSKGIVMQDTQAETECDLRKKNDRSSGIKNDQVKVVRPTLAHVSAEEKDNSCQWMCLDNENISELQVVKKSLFNIPIEMRNEEVVSGGSISSSHEVTIVQQDSIMLATKGKWKKN